MYRKEIEEYIREYEKKFSERISRRKIGLELEFPVVERRDFSDFNVNRIFPILTEKGWRPLYDDHYTDSIIGVEDREGKIVTTDAGQGLLEVNFLPRTSLFEIEEKESAFLFDIRETFLSQEGLILGYGVQPRVNYSPWVKKRHYEVVVSRLPKAVNLITLGAASQVHIDISKKEIIPALNVFNALSGIFISIFSNSPIWKRSNNGYLANRESFWEEFASERSGMTPCWFSDVEEYLLFMMKFESILAKNNKGYFAPSEAFEKFLVKRNDFINCWIYHEVTAWWDARPRAILGTIEIRPACCQPHSDYLTVAAFSLGIIENLEDFQQFCKDWYWRDWQELRKEAIQKGMEARIRGKSIIPLIDSALFLSELGLKKRGLGEEIFLEPLKKRLERREPPAKRVLQVFEKKGLEGLVKFTSGF